MAAIIAPVGIILILIELLISKFRSINRNYSYSGINRKSNTNKRNRDSNIGNFTVKNNSNKQKLLR